MASGPAEHPVALDALVGASRSQDPSTVTRLVAAARRLFALAQHPAARWVFAAYHIGGCDGCSSASNETLAEVAEGYRLNLEKLLSDLNGLK